MPDRKANADLNDELMRLAAARIEQLELEIADLRDRWLKAEARCTELLRGQTERN